MPYAPASSVNSVPRSPISTQPVPCNLRRFTTSFLCRPPCAITPTHVFNKPAAWGSGRCVLAIHRTHGHQQFHTGRAHNTQLAALDVVFHHEQRHVAKAEASTQKGVPGSHICESPHIRRKHAVVLAFRQ